MISTSDFKNGLHIEWAGEPYTIVWFQHHKPGKGGAIMRVKLKNIHTGSLVDRTFKSGEKFRDIIVENRRVQYLYADNSVYHFMDMNTYEQLELGSDMVGENNHFLRENMEMYIVSCEGRIIGIELPSSVELKVTYTEPGVKGDTVNRVMKPAKLETGTEIKVPNFINVDDVVRIDTRTGEYVERA